MNTPVKILIVEDEMLIAANVSLELTSLGYEVIGIIPRGEEALLHIRENQPDILLLDINLKGNLDGIEVATEMQKEFDIPVVYLTANTDDAHFNRAKETRPYAFISKPFKKKDLQRALELTLTRLASEKEEDSSNEGIEEEFAVFEDALFVRFQDKMVKVPIAEIQYIEADRNYCRIHSLNKEYLLVLSLKEMEDKLPKNHFIRIHRSYIVNISQITEIATTHLVVNQKALAISKGFKKDLLKRIQTV
ncbi:LytR/AlgR family response regulator transcription factor [Arcticibacterium luteifluviistationis]|uniref:DNA-binding response regulator n=1 Tax=Arcticibacterium luteifluviistationis TaxID=1784714 RepID=A0A2Z4G7C1_9BACT|nr:LytTR family transcriptional regulator DNA-binding domain-containing protein [Arcticibacterium luteifluviistationis]AWV96958.1 DNA-binding response regulator [Arcticibacterium luteifluviistationis]